MEDARTSVKLENEAMNYLAQKMLSGAGSSMA